MLFEINFTCVIAIVIAIAVVSIINALTTLVVTNKMFKSIENIYDRFMDSLKDMF